jgi:transposase
MGGTVTWAGLDVHARSTHAAAINVLTGEITRARFGPGIAEPIGWLAALPGPVKAFYEAGPTGFGLFRAARAAGVEVAVVAPGKTPRGPSDRVKTDRKDAELLARLGLAGSLVEIVVPPAELEAARDLMRAHDAARRDLMTARHRVSKLLLRHGRVYPETSTWTARHRRWLARQAFEHPGTELAFIDALACVDGLTARKLAIAERLSHLAGDEQWWPTVARLRAFYAVDTLTAFALHLELGGDWQRFARAPQLAAWLGLVPSLQQSGESSRSGQITKTGSTLARRLLVEAAWHYARKPGPSAKVLARRDGQPDHIIQIAERARRRLHRVHHRMRQRSKPGNVTVVACARELSCFLWAAATAD